MTETSITETATTPRETFLPADRSALRNGMLAAFLQSEPRSRHIRGGVGVRCCFRPMDDPVVSPRDCYTTAKLFGRIQASIPDNTRWPRQESVHSTSQGPGAGLPSARPCNGLRQGA
ncbi:hypothetical protein CERZMDRAFT_86285 [Cercospora zeae-maydis SCOH1-5]|uniref:Uncharacterized protein n=1 Tax=Cercospora zeae-maydis SCOH1-5 TaxID=717836 RepID=A0A6A6FA07_9PEZI|nr:hypothetical protein CERZMDRAFT_86285 [Cercospora zeae-maydis SCOH1-5]